MSTGKTNQLGIPYPLETDVPDVAADMQSLATALDDRGFEDFYQPGVVGKNDFKVTGTYPNYTIGAGTGWLSNVTYGAALCRQIAIASAAAPAVPTAPGALTVGQWRSDLLVLQSSRTMGGAPTFAWVQGTTQSGGTNPVAPPNTKNSYGAVANGTMPIAELVYNYSGTGNTMTLYDRRPWATGGASSAFNSGMPVNCGVQGTVIAQLRLECGNRPLRVVASGLSYVNGTGATKQPFHAVEMDGNGVASADSTLSGNSVATGLTVPMRYIDTITVPGVGQQGSHLFQWVTGHVGSATDQWSFDVASGIASGLPSLLVWELPITFGGNGTA